MRRRWSARGFGTYLTIRECLCSLLFLASLQDGRMEMELVVTPESFPVILGGNTTIRVEFQTVLGEVDQIIWKKVNGAENVICSLEQNNMFKVYRNPANCARQGQAAVLILANLSSTDVGRYEFKLILKDGKIFRTSFTGRFYAPISKPFIVTQLDSDEGRCNVTLTCGAVAGTDRKFNWTVDGQSVESKNSTKYLMSENRSVLTIEGVDRSDCHVYTCEVWNEHSREKAHFNASEFVNFTFCGEVARQTHASTNLGVFVGVPVSLIAIAIAIAAIGVCLKKHWPPGGSGGPCADNTADIPMREISAAPSHSVTDSDGTETDPSVQQALLPNPSVPPDMLDAHQ